MTLFSTESPYHRDRLYGVLAGLLFLLSGTLAGIKAASLHQRFDLAVSDGRYYYAYLPSLIVDQDLDFSNQIQEHWGSDFQPGLIEDRTAKGYVRNKYPIGFALTLLPAYLAGYGISSLSGVHDGYGIAEQVACLLWIQFLVWRTLVRIDRILIDCCRIPASSAVTAIFLYTLATPYLYYVGREPMMVHAVSTFWCVELAYRLIFKPGQPFVFWIGIGLSFSMAVVCRPTNVHLLPMLMGGTIQVLRSRGLRTSIIPMIIGASAAAIPVGCQLITWHTMTGAWLNYSYGDEKFDWRHPKLLETLLSSRHGLWFWSPVLFAATIGWFRHTRNLLIALWLAGAFLLWYANSSWHCWWFGDSFGGRAFLELSGLFCLGLATCLSRIRNYRKLIIVIFLVTITFNTVLMAAYITRRIPRGDAIWPGWIVDRVPY